jgi:hypothetical protein
MRRLSDSELLEAWERGQGKTPVRRALVLLSAACPESQAESLAELSVGQRDALLLTLREWTFGPRMTGLTSCTRCGEQLEFDCEAAQLRVSSEAAPPAALELSATGYELQFRLPNSLDLEQAAQCRDAAASQRLLLEQCLLSARRGDSEVSAEHLPPEIREAASARMAEADPQADLQLHFSCPQCGHSWQARFDIESFFWSEISAWAVRLLREVHALARAYGWREADILALSPWRRQMYLRMKDEG